MSYEIVRAIAIYSFVVFVLFVSYVGSYGMDKIMYICSSKKKTIRIGLLKWIFWNHNRKNRNEIYVIAFIHEFITVLLFIVETGLFIYSCLVLDNLILMLSCFVCFFYVAYTAPMQRYIARKNGYFKGKKREE